MYTPQHTTVQVESAPQGAEAWLTDSLVHYNHCFQPLIIEKLYHQDSLETQGQ